MIWHTFLAFAQRYFWNKYCFMASASPASTKIIMNGFAKKQTKADMTALKVMEILNQDNTLHRFTLSQEKTNFSFSPQKLIRLYHHFGVKFEVYTKWGIAPCKNSNSFQHLYLFSANLPFFPYIFLPCIQDLAHNVSSNFLNKTVNAHNHLYPLI